MGLVNPPTVEQAPPQVREVFDKVIAREGKVPNASYRTSASQL